MKVTTLRLPEGLYDDLAEEAAAQDRSFSEYARMLLRNREGNTNTQQHTKPNTTEYDQLRDRVADLEDRVDELAPADGGAESLNQQPEPDTGRLLVNDGADDLPGAVDVDDNPHSQTVERAVQWARKHEPVRRAELREAFAADVDIKWESLWERHLRDALKEDGFGYDRSGGVATWQR